MKKLLIASSVLAALSMMNVANADPLTQNGGTIEFIGEITDTTCWAGVDGTTERGTGTTSTGNVVLLPTVTKNLLDGTAGKTAGRTKFNIAVRSDIASTDTNGCRLGTVSKRDANGIPDGTSKSIDKVRAIFGATLNGSDEDIYNNPGNGYNAGNLSNVDMATGRLVNIASVANANSLRTFDAALAPAENGAATGVSLQLLNEDYTVIKVGDVTSQMTSNTYKSVASGSKTLLPYYVQYYADAATVTTGMVRSFVVYDLYYE